MSIPIMEKASRAIVDISARMSGVEKLSDFLSSFFLSFQKYVEMDWVLLVIMQKRGDQLPINETITYNQDKDLSGWWEYYQDNLLEHDFVWQHIMKSYPGEVSIGLDLRDPNNFHHNDLVEQWAKKTGVRQVLAGCLVNDPRNVVALLAYRESADKPFLPEERDLLQAVFPFLRTEFEAIRMSEQSRLMLSCAQEILNDSSRITILFDETMRVQFIPDSIHEQLDPFFHDEKWEVLPSTIHEWVFDCYQGVAAAEYSDDYPDLVIEAELGKLICNARPIMGSREKPSILVKLEIERKDHDFRSLKSLNLSDIEIETISFLPLGYTNRQMAVALGVQEVTVKKRLQSIGEKLGATGRTEILYQALKRSQKKVK